jgi:hypothetical protein
LNLILEKTRDEGVGDDHNHHEDNAEVEWLTCMRCMLVARAVAAFCILATCCSVSRATVAARCRVFNKNLAGE